MKQRKTIMSKADAVIKERIEMNKDVTAYNLIFPIWLLWIAPITWIVILPLNFVIDFAVLAITLWFLKESRSLRKTWRVIFPVWLCGLMADAMGSFILLAVYMGSSGMGDWWQVNFNEYNPFSSVYSTILNLVVVAFVGYLIYIVNRKWCFRALDLSDWNRKRLAISLAIFTAPYTFLLPTEWFF